MAVPDADLLLTMGRAHARIHVEHDASRRAAAVHKVDPLAGQVGNPRGQDSIAGCVHNPLDAAAQKLLILLPYQS